MAPNRLRIVIVLMSLAVIGVAGIQTYSIIQAKRLNEGQFDKNVQAALAQVVYHLEKAEVDEAVKYYHYEPVLADGAELDADEISAYLNSDTSRVKPFSQETVPIDRFSHLGEMGIFKKKNQDRMDVQKIEHDIARFLAMRGRVPLMQRLSLSDISALLKDELIQKGINTSFNYGIYDTQKKTFVDVEHISDAPNDGNVITPKHLGEAEIPVLRESPYRVKLFPGSMAASGELYVVFPQKSSLVWSSLWFILGATIIFVSLILGCFAYTLQVILLQKKVSEIKNDFINNMTHEFKTPIATISLATDSLTHERIIKDEEKVKRFAGIIKQENNRMNAQVERVLQMAQIDRKELNLHIDKVDMHSLITSAVTNMSLIVESRGGQIHCNLDASNSIIEADSTHINNVVHNLMDNANKYSPETPDITISTRDGVQGIYISVSDKGLGISKDARKLVFDKFYRVHTGNVHDVKGFGLGLSYVKVMVTAHGGHIDVKSEIGKGSTFTMFLPYKQAVLKR